MKNLFIALVFVSTSCFANESWEKLTFPSTPYKAVVYRLSIAHGWLLYINAGGLGAIAQVFVPDEAHVWYKPFNWIKIPTPQSSSTETYKIAVPHGWVVYTGGGGLKTPALTIVPDENQEWR